MNMVPEDILKGWKILVIDDEPDAAEVTKILLEMYQADVSTATNGREGLEWIVLHRPRFIICDISMPEMSGWEVIERLKLDRATAAIPVIALTAHAMSGDRQKAIAQGFHNYLTKPLHPETFVQQLLTLLTDDIPELLPLLS
jgi:CheY-like chemotaxis protein